MQLVNAGRFGLTSVPPRTPGTIFLAALLGISLFIAALILSSFWSSIIVAVVIGIGFYPLHKRISTAMKRRNLSALLSVLAVLLILLLPVIFFSSIASNEIAGEAQRLRANPVTVDRLIHSTDRAVNWLSKYVDVDRTGIKSAIDTLPLKASQTLVVVATSLIAGLASFVGQVILTLFILFFVFRDGPGATRWVASLVPMQRESVERLFVTIKDGVFANLIGVVAVAIIQGLLTGLGFMVMGLPSPVLFGVVAAAFSVVPLVGTSLVWVPASVFLLASGHWIKGMLLLAWGALIVGTADNVVRPLVIMQRVKLHPVILLFALLGGVREFGFVGLFVGPLVMSVIFALVEMLRDKSIHATGAAEPAQSR